MRTRRVPVPIRLGTIVVLSLLGTVAQLGGIFAAYLAYLEPEQARPLLLAAVVLFLLAYGDGWLADPMALALQEDLADRAEQRLWRHLLALPVTFFSARSLRDVIGYANCVSMTRTLLGALGAETILSGLSAGIATALLAAIDLRLGLAALALAVALLLTAALLARAQQRHDHVVMESVDAAHATLYPALGGIEELTAYRAQESVERAWQAILRRQKDADLRGLRYADAGESLLLASQTVMLAVLCPLALRWSGGPVALGSVAMITLTLASALSRVAGVLPAVFSIGLARRRLEPVRATEPEQSDTPRHEAVVAGAVVVAGAGFAYAGSEHAVLRGVTLRAAPGQLVAVVGPSGAGKSTLLRLLLAQLEPTEGTVSVDGVPTEDWDHECLRSQIGYVPQSASLSRGTIRDAVVGVLDTVPDEEVCAALSLVGLDDLVATLPMGLDTRITDGESGFSGGQEQRLLLARALVRRPRILLLDEATSALDEQAQEAVTRAIAGLGMTRIVVAHRHSTIVSADRVYVLDGGTVVEDGTYAELVHRGGRLAALTHTSPADPVLEGAPS